MRPEKMNQRQSCFLQAEDRIRDIGVTGVQTCALPISDSGRVLLHGRDVRDDDVLSLRRRVVLVPQLPAPLAQTVAGDVRYAAPEADVGSLLEREIGRASCTERVQISVVAVSLQRKTHN